VHLRLDVEKNCRDLQDTKVAGNAAANPPLQADEIKYVGFERRVTVSYFYVPCNKQLVAIRAAGRGF
jgi:hypothetical protein